MIHRINGIPAVFAVINGRNVDFHKWFLCVSHLVELILHKGI